MPFLGIIPDDIIAELERDGEAILKWVVSEAQSLVAIAKNDDGFVGFIAGVIDALDGGEGDGKSGPEKMAELVMRGVPELVKVLTSGKSAFAVVETEIFDLMREVGQSIYNDVKGVPQAKAVLDALNLG